MRSQNPVEFKISPTIFDNQIKIDYFYPTKATGEMIFYDMQGRILTKREFKVNKGNNKIHIDGLHKTAKRSDFL